MFAEFEASSRLVWTESIYLTWPWKWSDCDPSKRHLPFASWHGEAGSSGTALLKKEVTTVIRNVGNYLPVNTA
jgi:hypothetical protein